MKYICLPIKLLNKRRSVKKKYSRYDECHLYVTIEYLPKIRVNSKKICQQNKSLLTLVIINKKIVIPLNNANEKADTLFRCRNGARNSLNEYK